MEPFNEERAFVDMQQQEFQQLNSDKKFGGQIMKVGELNVDFMKQLKDETLFYIFYNMPH